MRILYVDPNGNDNNSGRSIDSPLATISAAHALVEPGDTIFLRGGTYEVTKDTPIRLTKSGTDDAPIRLMAYQDETPILDGSAWTRGDRKPLVIQTGDHWHVEGLEITASPFLGYLAESVTGSVYKDLNVHSNDDTGFSLNGESAQNQILGGDFHNNYDPASFGQDADGIAIKFGSGEGNVIDGARLYNNSDDGLDMYDFNGSVTVGNTLAYGNGVDRWGVGARFDGNGNGFKLSGGSTAPNTDLSHIVHNNAAWGNTSRGFDYNGSTGRMEVFNNTSFDNGFAGFFFEGGSHSLRNNLSFDNSVDQLVGPGVREARNSWNLDVSVTPSDFETLNPSTAAQSRTADGEMPDSGFLRLRPTSDLLDVGVRTGEAFAGAGPDLGAFEFEQIETPQPGTLRGIFFTDLDGDTVFDANEVGAVGHRIELYNFGDRVATTATNPNGVYSFQDVVAGAGYTVRFYHQGAETDFDVQDGQFVGNAGNLNTAVFTVGAGQTVRQNALLEAPEMDDGGGGTEAPGGGGGSRTPGGGGSQAPGGDDSGSEIPDRGSSNAPGSGGGGGDETPDGGGLSGPDDGDDSGAPDNPIRSGTDASETMTGTPAADKMNGLRGNDNLRGQDGDDQLYGNRGRDDLVGGKDNDILKGGQGADILKGGAGNDVLSGKKGNDLLQGHGMNDKLRGGLGDDVLFGGQGEDIINGGQGEDKARGGAGADKLSGQGGDDIVIGGRGNDRLDGGAGNDRLTGGADLDVFAFGKGYGADVITDFQSGTDQIDLSDFAFASREQALSNASQIGNDLVLNFGDGDLLTIKDATQADIATELLLA